MMRKIVCCMAAGLLLLAAAWGQTPEEIVARMEKSLEPAESQGLSMAMDFKIPIIGTSTTQVYILGGKTRSETRILGHELVTFSDGVTDWEYDSFKKELTIGKAKPAEKADGSEAEMFEGITDGYDVSLQKETADAWHLRCKKNKNNPEKDAPDRMDLVVSKKNLLPISLTAKIEGIKIVLHDLVVGVDPAKVTFRMEDYPGAKIIDKR